MQRARQRLAAKVASMLLICAATGLVSSCSATPDNPPPCYVQESDFRWNTPGLSSHMLVLNDQRWCSIVFHIVSYQPIWLVNGTVASAPSHGEVRVRKGAHGPNFWYRPAVGFTGTDEFEIEVSPLSGPFEHVGKHWVSVEVRGPNVVANRDPR